MNPDTIVALSAGIVTVLVAALAVLIQRRIGRFEVGRVQLEFETAEKRVREAIEAVETEPESRGVTWGDLERGNFRDEELRAQVGLLLTRLSRLERFTERLSIRRQALLETYHNQGLSQSRVSFGFSLALGVLGFGVIAFAVVTKSDQIATYAAGTLTEAVAALFLSQSNASRALMSQFFDRLRADRRLEEALRLVEEIDDPQLKASLQALLAMQFVESSHSPSVLPGFKSEQQRDGETATART